MSVNDPCDTRPANNRQYSQVDVLTAQVQAYNQIFKTEGHPDELINWRGQVLQLLMKSKLSNQELKNIRNVCLELQMQITKNENEWFVKERSLKELYELLTSLLFHSSRSAVLLDKLSGFSLKLQKLEANIMNIKAIKKDRLEAQIFKIQELESRNLRLENEKSQLVIESQSMTSDATMLSSEVNLIKNQNNHLSVLNEALQEEKLRRTVEYDLALHEIHVSQQTQTEQQQRIQVLTAENSVLLQTVADLELKSKQIQLECHDAAAALDERYTNDTLKQEEYNVAIKELEEFKAQNLILQAERKQLVAKLSVKDLDPQDDNKVGGLMEKLKLLDFLSKELLA